MRKSSLRLCCKRANWCGRISDTWNEKYHPPNGCKFVCFVSTCHVWFPWRCRDEVFDWQLKARPWAAAPSCGVCPSGGHSCGPKHLTLHRKSGPKTLTSRCIAFLIPEERARMKDWAADSVTVVRIWLKVIMIDHLVSPDHNISVISTVWV